MATNNNTDTRTIEITKDYPFIVREPDGKGGSRDVKVAKIVVETIKFADFTSCSNRASSLSRGGDQFRKFLLREQRKVQCRVYDAKNKLVTVGDGDFLNLPMIYAGRMTDLINDQSEKRGEVVIKGDGISTPVLYRLGSALRTGKDGVAIEELEFSARTLGDIEDILAETSPLSQALALVKKCAKPVGGDVTLIALPSWAVEEMSLTDGVTIMEQVLPGFLSSRVE